MSILITILVIWGLWKIIRALGNGATRTRTQKEQNNAYEVQMLCSDAQRSLKAVQTARSVSGFMQSYHDLSIQLDAIQGKRNRTLNHELRTQLDNVANNMIKNDSEEYRWLLRNAIERQCADAVKNIRTTYKNSKTFRDSAYSSFCREVKAYNSFYDEETREYVQRCLERVDYEYNGQPRSIPFHNDMADYERSLLTPSLRYEILRRDKFRCTICGRGQEDGVKLHVDHIKPVSKGGRTIPENLRTLCQDCNLGKSDSYYEGEYN